MIYFNYHGIWDTKFFVPLYSVVSVQTIFHGWVFSIKKKKEEEEADSGIKWSFTFKRKLETITRTNKNTMHFKIGIASSAVSTGWKERRDRSSHNSMREREGISSLLEVLPNHTKNWLFLGSISHIFNTCLKTTKWTCAGGLQTLGCEGEGKPRWGQA